MLTDAEQPVPQVYEQMAGHTIYHINQLNPTEKNILVDITQIQATKKDLWHTQSLQYSNLN